MDSFQELYGERGNDVLRFEWRSWKRILQTSKKRQWLNVQHASADVMNTIYRSGERSQDDFSLLCSREGKVRPVDPEGVTGPESLRNEYLQSVASPGRHYTVSEDVPSMGPEGAPITRTQVTHFHLLDMAHGNKRPKLLHTSETADEVALKAALALHVVKEERREPAGDVAERPDAADVYPGGDPEWVRPQDLVADSTSWMSRFFVWDSKPSDHVGCLRLENPTKVKNQLALTDPHCPHGGGQGALALDQMGWCAEKGHP